MNENLRFPNKRSLFENSYWDTPLGYLSGLSGATSTASP